MGVLKQLLEHSKAERPPSVATIVVKALEAGQIEQIAPTLPAVEREVALWYTQQNQHHNKRWELLYLLLGLLFGGGGGIGYGLVKSSANLAASSEQAEDQETLED